MYKKILVPIDGSELSYMAVAGAASFAKTLAQGRLCRPEH